MAAAKCSYALSFEFKGEKKKKTFRSKDGDTNMKDIASFLQKKFNVALQSDCYIKINDIVIDCSVTLMSVLTENGAYSVVVEEGSLPNTSGSTNGTKFVLFCNNKQSEWFLNENDKGEGSLDLFKKNIYSLFGIDVDADIEIYHVENEDDTDSREAEIECDADLDDALEDIDDTPGGQHALYFVIVPTSDDSGVKEKNKLFMFQFNGNSVSFAANVLDTKDANSVMKEIDTLLMKNFDGLTNPDNFKIVYSKSNNNNTSLHASKDDILSQTTITSYWNAFKSDTKMEAIYFDVLDSNMAEDEKKEESEEITQRNNIIKTILAKWSIDAYYDKFIEFEFVNVKNWDTIDINDLNDMGMGRGSAKTFLKQVQNGDHLTIFNKLTGKEEEEEKKDPKLLEREIFADGINVVPFERREYQLPELKQTDYAFKGGNGFTSSAISIIKTLSSKVFNLGRNVAAAPVDAKTSVSHRKPERLFGSDDHKIILVCGKTGAGKSTLINSMMNYIYNVQQTDNFRLKLIQEKKKAKGNAESCTDHISSYTIKKPKGGNINYDLTIVDTPGFGDARGIQKDMQILEEFKYVFNSILTNVHAVCFVVKSADNRLDAAQTYVFNNILNLWAKDVLDNIFILMTFADGKRSNCIDALDANDVFKTVKRRFKINNSAFTDDPVDQDLDNLGQFDKLFWNMGMDCFKRFFDELDKVKPKSIDKSKEVLRQRDRIQTSIHHISMNLNSTLQKQQQIHRKQQFVKEKEEEINAGKNVTWYDTRIEYQSFPVDNCYVTTCMTCLRSCHPTCCVENKRSCCMINSDGYCTVCTCPVTQHQNQSYEYRPVPVQVKVQNWDTLKSKYDKASKDHNIAADHLKSLEKQLKGFEKDAQRQVAMVQQLRNQLEEIALRPHLSTVGDYIDQMIENEKESPTKDDAKITLLKDLKKSEELITELQKNGKLVISKKDYLGK